MHQIEENTSLLLLLLSHFSCVRFCTTPQTAAHQAPPSLGFSRQEYWSWLPFPSPMHACMLNRFSRVRFCATPWTAATQQSPLTTGFSRQEYWSGLPPLSPEFLGSIKNLTRQTSHFRPVSCISVYGNATLPVVETCFPTAHQEILLFLPSQ